MQKFSYYQFVKEAAMQKQAFKAGAIGGMRRNGRRGIARRNKVYPWGNDVAWDIGAKQNSAAQAIADDTKALARLLKQHPEKLRTLARKLAQQTGAKADDVLNQLKGALGAAADKAKGAAGAAGSKAKATAEAGKDALIGAYEKAKPAVQEAGQKALAWLGGHRQGLRDIGLGALLGDALLDEE